jgi:hypothetical protein
VIELEVKDGLYIIKGPKYVLVMTKAEFIQSLRRGKWWNRRQAMAERNLPCGEK